MSTTVHFGVVTTNEDEITPWDALEPALTQESAQRRHTGYIAIGGTRYYVDGDSFCVWGEQLPESREDDEQGLFGDPVHVTFAAWANPTGHYSKDQTMVDHWRGQLTRVLPAGLRLVDYVVLTDSGEWSKDVRIVGRFA